MARRPWRIVLAATPLLVASAACSDDDDADPSPTSVGATAAVAATATDATAAATTSPPTTAPLTTTAPSLTTPASVITDTEAVGGSTLSTVDLTTGTATPLGAVGAEVGVLGIAVEADGTVIAVTDAPGLLVLDPAALPPGTTPTPIDTGGATLLAVARRPSDDARFAVGDAGGIVRLDPTTATVTPVAEVAVDDPGVGLDVADDGTLEVVVGDGARFAVDPETGDVTELPPLTADEAPPRIVALAHDADGRYGIDASTDELVRIADDGLVDTIGPLGFDVTDGASLDIGPDGVVVLANPG